MSQIVGVFHDEAAATRAVDALVEAHFSPRREIVVTAVDGKGDDREVPVVHRTRVPLGLAVGVLCGLAIGGAVAIALWGSDFGDGVAWKVAFLATALGALVGVLWGLTYWWDRPDFTQTPGATVSPIHVSVDATNLRGRADEAREIFARTGAVEVM
jgi:hypothetical protein